MQRLETLIKRQGSYYKAEQITKVDHKKLRRYVEACAHVDDKGQVWVKKKENFKCLV